MKLQLPVIRFPAQLKIGMPAVGYRDDGLIDICHRSHLLREGEVLRMQNIPDLAGVVEGIALILFLVSIFQ